jgi:hypothetical protein
MAAKKRASKPKTAFSINVPGTGTLEFRAPGIVEFDRYIAKRRQDQLSVGRREMSASCCVSHSGEDVHAIFRKRPALPRKIADELEDLAGMGEVATVNEDDATASVITLDGDTITIRTPTTSEWEGIENTNAAPLDFSKTVREFITNLCAEPATGAFEKYPSLPFTLLDAAAELAGAGLEIEVKKG